MSANVRSRPHQSASGSEQVRNHRPMRRAGQRGRRAHDDKAQEEPQARRATWAIPATTHRKADAPQTASSSREAASESPMRPAGERRCRFAQLSCPQVVPVGTPRLVGNCLSQPAAFQEGLDKLLPHIALRTDAKMHLDLALGPGRLTGLQEPLGLVTSITFA